MAPGGVLAAESRHSRPGFAMPSARKPAAAAAASSDAASVDDFLATLDHPHADALVALRGILLAADPSIAEGIKWNVPSFRTTDWFATSHLRAKTGLGVILHFGAKKNAISADGVAIPDPYGLLQWLAKDRALVAFRDAADVAARRDAFTTLVRHWIVHV